MLSHMSSQPLDSGIPADTFETRLVIARFYAGRLSVTEAAKRVGVSHTAWANWEKGVNTPANKPSMVAYIARQLGVDEDWLRDGGPLRPAQSDPRGGLRLVNGDAERGQLQPSGYTDGQRRPIHLAAVAA